MDPLSGDLSISFFLITFLEGKVHLSFLEAAIYVITMGEHHFPQTTPCRICDSFKNALKHVCNNFFGIVFRIFRAAGGKQRVNMPFLRKIYWKN